MDMRKLERQLRVLPGLLNSCPRHASKVTRVRTLANMLAAAPLASSTFSEVDKLVRIYLTIPVTTTTGESSISVPPMRQILPEICHAPAAPQQHICSSVSTRIWRMDWICPPSPGSSWTPMNAAGISLALCSPQWNPPERLGLTLWTVRLELFGNLTTCILLYYTNDYCIWL